LRLYFRSIEEVGERPSPEVRGRVFVSNHSNALIDPILVLTHARCDISPLGKSTLWQIPGLKYLLDLADAVPIQRRRDDPNKDPRDNDKIFDKIAQHLRAGGNVLVFPEGTSHNEPHMIRLRTGAARMLERAAQLGARDLTFQAVGLEFDARGKFRSSAVVAYGPVRRFDELSGELVEQATRVMRDDLTALVIEGEDWDERRLVLRVAELLRNERGDVSLAEAVRIAQEVEHARDVLRAMHPEVARAVEQQVRDYFAALESSGLRDDQLSADGERLPTERLPKAAWLTLPLLPVGAVLYFLPYQLPRLVARRTDEIDQHSTLKLATGLVAYPLWAALLCAIAWRALDGRRARALSTLTIVAAPFAALYWLENLERLKRELRLARRSGALPALLARRAQTLAAIERARAAVTQG
jgi:glycerol-3-phosphate O-acyltransferase/dihydroxyacetone phosphate acyltransferase